MKSIRVTFDNGDHIETNINGTDAEIRAYYMGQWFNLGSGENDAMARGVCVEFLAEAS